MHRPKVSVIIPTYNRACFVLQAIESVFSQTYKNFEIIVVDDGSTDDTREVLTNYSDKIIYIYQKNQGVSAARNTGIENSHGKYIAFLDSDDSYFPTKLEKQIKILDEHEDISVVYTNYSCLTTDGIFIKSCNDKKMYISGDIYKETLLIKAMFGQPPTWLIRKTCFNEIGYFDTKLKMSEDRDMSVRLAKKYKIYGIAEPLVLARDTKSSLGRCSTREREYYRLQFINKLFTEINPTLDVKTKKQLLAHYYFIAGLGYLKETNHATARKRFLKAIFHYPFKLNVYFYFFSTLLGKDILKIAIIVRKWILKKHYSKKNYEQLYYIRK